MVTHRPGRSWIQAVPLHPQSENTGVRASVRRGWHVSWLRGKASLRGLSSRTPLAGSLALPQSLPPSDHARLCLHAGSPCGLTAASPLAVFASPHPAKSSSSVGSHLPLTAWGGFH